MTCYDVCPTSSETRVELRVLRHRVLQDYLESVEWNIVEEWNSGMEYSGRME